MGVDVVRGDVFGPEIREVGLNGQLQLQVNMTEVGFSPCHSKQWKERGLDGHAPDAGAATMGWTIAMMLLKTTLISASSCSAASFCWMTACSSW